MESTAFPDGARGRQSIRQSLSREQTADFTNPKAEHRYASVNGDWLDRTFWCDVQQQHSPNENQLWQNVSIHHGDDPKTKSPAQEPGFPSLTEVRSD